MNTCLKIAGTQLKGKPIPRLHFFGLLFEPLSSCLFLPGTSNSLSSGHLNLWYSYDGHCLSLPVASKTLTSLPQPCQPLAGFSSQLSPSLGLTHAAPYLRCQPKEFVLACSFFRLGSCNLGSFTDSTRLFKSLPLCFSKFLDLE